MAPTEFYPEDMGQQDDDSLPDYQTPPDGVSEDDAGSDRDTPPGANEDFYVDEQDAVWKYLPEAIRYASNTASFCFSTGPELDWFDQSISRSLYTGECWQSFLAPGKKKTNAAARKEASTVELRSYAKQFAEAKKAEITSWQEHEVYRLVDMRKHKPKNYVTGRWVLTIKRNNDGSFQKCKARWVLRGFQDRQKWDQQTDSPTATRPAFRLGCQKAANEGWDLLHIDLKTAFLQGEDYDAVRDVVCQLPPEMGYPSSWSSQPTA